MSKIIATITTFFPKIEVIKNIELIKKQVDLTLIIDNGSDEISQSYLRRFENDPQVKIIRNGQNLGIATSCNLAARFLLEANKNKENFEPNLVPNLSQQPGFPNSENSHSLKKSTSETFDWLMTFDQDSTPELDFVQKMLTLATEIENQSGYRDQVGVICPTYFYQSLNKLEKKNPTNSDFWEIKGSMSSGSLIHRRVFERGLFYEDKFFVDYFDLEFHLKVRHAGLKLLEASNIQLVHELGNLSRHKFFGKNFITPNYPAFRVYYQARNRWLLYWRYWQFDTSWSFQDLRNSCVNIIKLLLAEDQKLPKLQAFFLGTWHGLISYYQNPAPKFK